VIKARKKVKRKTNDDLGPYVSVPGISLSSHDVKPDDENRLKSLAEYPQAK
jgi:hypothetical protein